VRSTALRLVQEGEEEELRVYYSTENTREYHEAEEQWLEVRCTLCEFLLIHSFSEFGLNVCYCSVVQIRMSRI